MSVVGCNNQRSTKDEYILQEKCGKSCEEYFRKTYGGLTDQQYTYDYKNHYNKNMNKCFILLDSRSPYSGNRKDLRDINENKQYGSFWRSSKGVITFCRVSKKECESEEEWDSLVKPYMEE
ncbi:MAG: hypothetical protein WC401_10940 [Bacteroidales bacterium]